MCPCLHSEAHRVPAGQAIGRALIIAYSCFTLMLRVWIR